MLGRSWIQAQGILKQIVVSITVEIRGERIHIGLSRRPARISMQRGFGPKVNLERCGNPADFIRRIGRAMAGSVDEKRQCVATCPAGARGDFANQRGKIGSQLKWAAFIDRSPGNGRP